MVKARYNNMISHGYLMNKFVSGESFESTRESQHKNLRKTLFQTTTYVLIPSCEGKYWLSDYGKYENE